MNGQLIDTIFYTSGWITSIELIENNHGEILVGNAGTSISKSTDMVKLG
jgi:hypothetical protein